MKISTVLLILFVVLTGCSSTYYANRAKVLLKKAEQKGANIKNDTIWTTVKLLTPGASVKWEPRAVIPGEMTFIRDSVITKIFFKDSPAGVPDTVEVSTDCPDTEKEFEVPIGINTEIDTGYSLWDLIILAIVCLFVGYIVGRLIRK